MNPNDNIEEEKVHKLLLTPVETAELIGIGRTKLYELLRDGVIESVRIGDCRRIPVAAVEDFVERLRSSQSAP